MEVEQALERYLRQLAANGRSPHTIGQAQRHLLLLARWLAQEERSAELDAIDEDVIAEFLVSDLARNTARGAPKVAATMNSLRSSLKTFFGHAELADWVSRSPALLVKRAACSPPPPRALTGKEQKRFFAFLDEAEGATAQRDRMLFTFMLRSGVRLSSALGIEVGDVDVEGRTVLLRTMKGRDVQRVFMPDKTAVELGRFLDGRRSGPVFARANGKRLSARHAQRRFRFWREKAGLPDTISPHSLRHSFAMALYLRTRDVLIVRAALRHASLSSTLVYTRVDPEGVREAVLAG